LSSAVAFLREAPPPGSSRLRSRVWFAASAIRELVERDLLRASLVLAWSIGCAMQIVDMILFSPTDWSDWAVVLLTACGAVISAVMPWKRISVYWVMPLVYLAFFVILLAAVTGGPEGVILFLFLPTLIATVFFWGMNAPIIATVVPGTVMLVAMGFLTGDAAEKREVLFVAPLLPLVSLLIGALYNSTRGASHEQERMRGTVSALLASLEARDGYTADHSSEVLDLVRAVAARLDLSEHEQQVASYVGLLHDIGKIGIPNSVLNKQGPLDDAEWEIMKTHPVIGEEIVREVPGFGAVADAVRHEHERWDGKGYPDGIGGETIPVGSRIVLACDAYHAMTSDRPYRKSMPQSKARAELASCAGTQFDPAVVQALLDELADRDQQASKNARKRAKQVLESTNKPLADSLYVGDQDHGRAAAEGAS
jgi:HD-GYP domain-containing protein (c-di-GMP phosphodiesterase class II)